jgi:hypothetical protein
MQVADRKCFRAGNSVFLLLKTEIKASNGFGAAQKGTVRTTIRFVLPSLFLSHAALSSEQLALYSVTW